MSMLGLDLRSVLHILVEILFVAVAMLTLFRLRESISLGPLYVFVGANQYLSILLAASIYVSISPSISISPGSAVFFTSSLFAVLLVYLRTDIPTSRGLIFGVVAANAALIILLWFTSYQLSDLEAHNILGLPAELFTISLVAFLTGTVLLLVDFLLIVVIYELLTLRATWMPKLGRITITMLSVLYFDSLIFSSVLALGGADFGEILRGQLIGKTLAGLAYSFLLTAYLQFVEPEPRKPKAQAIEDVFSIFTYRERYHQVRLQLEIAEAANLAKSRFLANMSHELRTPLNAIIGFTAILRERNKNADDRNYLTRVLDNGRHLLELINGLLDLSKIESGRNELNISQVDLNALMNETVGQLQSQASSKALDLRVELPPNTVTLATDPMRMKQILINLIGNSLKYTDNGEVVARLATDPKTGAPVRIDILDTGIGIPSNELDAIFEPFYQEEMRSRTDGGTGLGLAISRALCEQMGHQLKVSSEAGLGSQFSVVFANS